MAEVIYFSVDVEASGPVPGLFNLVSVGAVPVARRAGRWEVRDERLYVELRPIAAGFDPGAMAVHGITRAHLESNGVPADEALRRLSGFVAGVAGPAGATPVFVGHNAAFDWSFISYYYEWARLPNPFGYKALDTKSLAMGALGIDWLDTSKERLQALLPGLPPEDRARTHRADYDALFQAQILCALLNRGGGR